MKALLLTINGAVDSEDQKVLLKALMDPALSAKGVNSATGSYYMNHLKEIKEEKGQVRTWEVRTSGVTVKLAHLVTLCPISRLDVMSAMVDCVFHCK